MGRGILKVGPDRYLDTFMDRAPGDLQSCVEINSLGEGDKPLTLEQIVEKYSVPDSSPPPHEPK